MGGPKPGGAGLGYGGARERWAAGPGSPGGLPTSRVYLRVSEVPLGFPASLQRAGCYRIINLFILNRSLEQPRFSFFFLQGQRSAFLSPLLLMGLQISPGMYVESVGGEDMARTG